MMLPFGERKTAVSRPQSLAGCESLARWGSLRYRPRHQAVNRALQGAGVLARKHDRLARHPELSTLASVSWDMPFLRFTSAGDNAPLSGVQIVGVDLGMTSRLN